MAEYNPESLVGQRLGPYEIEAVIGGGGMGFVYSAYEPQMRRRVAVKVLRKELSQEKEFLERFKLEATTAGNLLHPNIIPIYRFEEDNGIHFIGMPLLQGDSVAKRLESLRNNGARGFDPERAADILKKVARGLQYAHDNGVIHRDIKPNNIIFDQVDNPIIVDFGIVRLLNHERITAPGDMLGTQAYMSPEQWEGGITKEIGPGADQYALACMIYELLTGQTPFQSNSPIEMMTKHTRDIPRPIHEIRRDLSSEVSDVLKRALSKEARERYPSVIDFAGAFTKATTVIEVPPPPPGPKLPLPLIVGGAVVVMALLALLVFLVVINPSIHSNNETAIAIAALGAEQTSTAVVMGILQTSTADAATQTANAPTATFTETLTLTPSPTATFTETPTPTSTLTPTPTPLPTSPDDILGALGINPANGQRVDYTVPPLVHNQDNNTWGWLGLGSTAGSFVFHTDFNFVSQDNLCGVGFWGALGTGNKLNIVRDYLTLETVEGEGLTPVKKSIYSNNIQSTLDAVNHLFVVADGSIFTVYINDLEMPIAVFTDEGFYGNGVNLHSANSQSNTPPCTFNNTWVWQSNHSVTLPMSIPDDAAAVLAAHGFTTASGKITQVVDEFPTLQLSDDPSHDTAWSAYTDSSNRSYTAFVAHVNITMGDPDDDCGVYFHQSEGKLYYFGLHHNSDTHRVYFKDHLQFYEGKNFDAGDDNGALDVVLIAVGNKFSLYIDGQLVDEREDIDNKSPSGYFTFTSWSPSGANAQGTPTCGYSDLWIWEPTPPVADAMVAITVSLTGDWNTDRQIYLLDSRAGVRTRLTFCDGFNYDAWWSHDGERLTYVSTCKTPDNQNGDPEIWVMDKDGNNQRQITRTEYWEEKPVWSPDSQHLAYLIWNDASKSDIYIIKSDGSETDGHLLISANSPEIESFPVWSPDGNKIAFSSKMTDGRIRLCYVSADGSGERTCPIDQGNPSDFGWIKSSMWTADSQSLVYRVIYEGEGGFAGLFIAPFTGENPRRLSGDGYAPLLSADGTTLFFDKQFEGADRVYRIRVDGSGIQRLSDDPGHEWNPAFFEIP